MDLVVVAGFPRHRACPRELARGAQSPPDPRRRRGLASNAEVTGGARSIAFDSSHFAGVSDASC